MEIVRSILLLYFVFCTTVTRTQSRYHFSAIRTTNEQLPSTSEKAGDALFLTPMLDAGQVDEARNRSLVEPTLFGNITTYAGFFTVNRTSKSHLYFWFVPKTVHDGNNSDHSSTPLLLALHSGPGVSSLITAFAEHGPFKHSKEEGLQSREYAWTKHYNVLFIDQPIGTGFSFTEEGRYLRTQEEVAEHLYEVLKQFYKLFQDFKQHDLYIDGASYGGKFAVAIGYKIHTTNQLMAQGFDKIPLKGLMIGDGDAEPETMSEYGAILYGLGLIDEYDRLKFESIQEKIKHLIRSEQWSLATNHCGILYLDVIAATNSNIWFDYTRDDLPHDIDNSPTDFITQNRIRRAMHAGHGKYVAFSQQVSDQFYEDMVHSVRPWTEELLEHYPMLYYNGQFDIITAYSLTANFLNSLHWKGSYNFSQARRQIWRVDDKVAGWKSSARLGS